MNSLLVCAELSSFQEGRVYIPTCWWISMQSKAAGCTTASSWLCHIGKSMQRRHQNQFKQSQAETGECVAHGKCAVTSRTVSAHCSRTRHKKQPKSWPEALLYLGWWTWGTLLVHKGMRRRGSAAGSEYCHSFFSPSSKSASLGSSVWNKHWSASGVSCFLNRGRNPGILSHLLGEGLTPHWRNSVPGRNTLSYTQVWTQQQQHENRINISDFHPYTLK